MFNFQNRKSRFRIIIPSYPAFNVYSFIARRTTALGPVYIASVVDKMDSWGAEVIDENNLNRYRSRCYGGGADHEILQREHPADVVGFYGGLTSTIPRLYKIARFYKEKGVITIAGGQHFVKENIHEALSSGIDYVVIGEGEKTIKELLCSIKEGRGIDKVKGIAYLKDEKVVYTPRREPIIDFGTLPLPDFSLVRYAKIRVYPVERIRGCGMNCEFCTVKGKPRSASAELLFRRITHLVETKKARTFFVVDDLFGQQRDETIRFCYMLRDYQKRMKIRLDLGVQIRLDKARDTELLSAMRQAGVNMVAIGFESPIDRELKTMNKAINAGDMISFAKVFRKFGFLIHGMFIFGYPLKEKFVMSAEERTGYFRDFIRRTGLDTVQVVLPVPLPGTELRDRLKMQNRIYSLRDVGWEYYDGSFPLFEPDQPMTAEDVQNSVKKILGRFYQFRYIFMVGINVFLFPYLILFFSDIKSAWRRWYRCWRNYILRFAGWITIRRWVLQFKKDDFLQKLKKAKENLKVMNQVTTTVE